MKIFRNDGRSAAALVLLLALTTAAGGLAAQQGGGIPLNPAHPDSYVVKKGDTLWDISGMFLQKPWYWPEIWYVNPQVENPHLIYPGDVLTLVYVDGQPQIRSSRSGDMAASGIERLSPQIREESLSAAVNTIPYEAIGPFLSKGMVLAKDEIDELPYILALRDGHLVAASGNDAYVRGTSDSHSGMYSVVHVGEKLVDPDDGALLGYEGVYVADARVRRAGDPATLQLSNSRQEAMKGDRLVTQTQPLPMQFMPRAPDHPVEGKVIYVSDGVTQIGQYNVVAINRGTRDGLSPGHVLTVWQAGDRVDDPYNSRFFSRKVQLPDERAGTLMIFRTYDRLSYALIMEAVGPIHTLDKVSNPS